MTVNFESEADHLHNLPALLTKYTPDLLDYYWTVERPCFIARSNADEIRRFEPLWERLETLLPARRQ